ncbi:MAG: Nif3-like dinuclear metal center hexameric protein [Bacteroidales bacterium]|nr:Nif3-like dinuclear metal center hexameric protein [Bacteroidales bacterium]
MKIKDIIKPLEDLAPLYLQESYDNTGLLIGNPQSEVKKILITLDVTEALLQEAIDKKCDLIISHHPLIFKGLKSITGRNATERIVEIAIRRDIAIYAIHTNLDNMDNGVNAILCKKLGLKNTKILSPKKELLRKLVTFCPEDHAKKVREAIFDAGAGHIGNYDSCSFNTPGTGSFRGSEDTNPFVGEKGKLHYENEVRIETIYPVYREQAILNALFHAHPYEEAAYDIYFLGNEFNRVGAGMIGELEKEVDEIDFLNKIKKITGVGGIKHSKLLSRKIKKVAVCGGSGSFLINDAKRTGADIFITGDVKYHDFFEAENKMVIADIGHYESEQFAKELIYSVLNEKFSNFAVLISETNTNSVNYL